MKKSRRLKTTVAGVLIVAFLGQACATTSGPLVGQGADPGRAALICGAGGALAGAATGAAIGALVKPRDPGPGALVGALIGAAVGALAAGTACFAMTYNSQTVKDYRETTREVSYQPSQGTVVQITEFQIAPAVAAPGDKVRFGAQYYVMGPEPDQDLALAETRVVTAVNPSTGERKELGRHTSQVTVKPGMRRGDGEFDVRSGVAEGRYEIVFEVEAAGQKDSKMLSLDVTKNVTALQDPGRRVARVVAEPVGGKAQPQGAAESQRTSTPSAAASAPPSAASGTGEATAPASPTASSPAQPLAGLGETNPPPPPAPQVAMAPQPVSPAKAARERYFVASKLVGKGTLRDGPGSAFKVVGEIDKGDRFVLLETVIASGASTPWHKIRLEDGREVWVSGAAGEEVQE